MNTCVADAIDRNGTFDQYTDPETGLQWEKQPWGLAARAVRMTGGAQPSVLVTLI